MTATETITNTSKTATSWSANMASLNFWETFYRAMVRIADERLSFEDLPILSVRYDPLNWEGRITGSKYAVQVSAGMLRFNAELEQLSGTIIFGVYAIGAKLVLGSDERLLQLGWLHITESDEGLKIESKPRISGCVTDDLEVDHSEFCRRAPAFAEWIFDLLVNRRFELLKHIAMDT